MRETDGSLLVESLELAFSARGRRGAAPIVPGCIVLGCLAWLAPAASGDVVEMADGRRFEGKILQETDSTVRLDAMVNGVRVQVGLPRREMASLERAPLPEGFFEPKVKADARVSKADRFPPGASLYVEVPIVGRFGLQVVPEGVKKCLAYAALHKIPHVVFHVDSQGGDQVAAKEIYDLLGKYQDRLEYHALVRDSLGVAMAVTVQCKSVFLLPGANLGGIELTRVGRGEEGDLGVFLKQAAWELGQAAETRGWPAPLVRAMIDPSEALYAWKEADGRIGTAVRQPSSVPADEILVRDGPESLLTLERSQAVSLGLGRAFSGGAAELGAVLGLDPWLPESDYGRKTMVAAARQEQVRMEKVSSRKDAEITGVLKKRDSTKQYIERHLKLAHQWDPEQSAYSTYDQYKTQWEEYWGGPQAKTITAPRWRELTDATLAALAEAYKGVREMKKLEEEGARLGLDPVYPPGDLDKLQQDIEVKATMVKFWRERKTTAS